MPAKSATAARPTPMSPPDDGRPAGDPQANATHLTIISVFNFIAAGMCLIGALFMGFVFGVGAAGAKEGIDAGAPGWIDDMIGALGFILVLILVGVSLVFFFAGLMTVKRKRAGKVLSMVAAVLHVVNFPIGTAIGIYGFVILADPKTEAYWVD